MSLGTYSDLQATVGRFARRNDLTVDIPTFIALAEAQISRRLRVRRMIKRITLTIDAEFVDVPDDFAGAVSLKLTSTSSKAALGLVSVQDMAVRKESLDYVGGEPESYAVSGASFEFGPVPGGSYDAQLVYYAMVPSLSDAAPTNWLLSTWPDLYLYGALQHTAPYMADDERLGVWKGQFEQILAEANTASIKEAGAGLLAMAPAYCP